jgi:hypothetical protein
MTPRRIVAVAVDAAGAAGNRPYSYAVPDALSDLAVGEAVLVEFGRRQALGIVLGPGAEVPGVETKPIAGRVRTDGPLLPALGMRLADWIATRYLAPPALTLRAMLPPGLLERLELVAERRPSSPDAPAAEAPLAPEDEAILEALAAAPKPVRSLEAAEGRPALLRRLRALEAHGLVDLDWTLLAAGAGPRWVRFVRATAAAAGDGEMPEARPPASGRASAPSWTTWRRRPLMACRRRSSRRGTARRPSRRSHAVAWSRSTFARRHDCPSAHGPRAGGGVGRRTRTSAPRQAAAVRRWRSWPSRGAAARSCSTAYRRRQRRRSTRSCSPARWSTGAGAAARPRDRPRAAPRRSPARRPRRPGGHRPFGAG